ncbi:terminase large subunit domain-containing protein [Leifsonia sp. NPDC058194]|uniref:terminase large subunit domain-containing protein n=1 Tax=Leifsonia sp. NPDC058194 TaxID=3346374 RepID=UPI0036D7F31E
MTRLTKSPPVELLGEAPPRALVEPVGGRANSWEDVADLSEQAGIVLDGWQEIILQAAMGERSDATWAAKRVGVSVPRQNGKSQLLVARALAGVLLFGEKKIVISAHQQDTAREAFSKMVEILDADGNGWLMDRVKPNGIMNAINREAVKFRNGATIQFKARTGSGGRGFSSDCLLLDEAQRLKRPAWVSINSTMSAMPNPQVWLLGTPPTREDVEGQMGEVFESIRRAAIDGTSTAAAWAEWGADSGHPDFDPASEYTRWVANPAWNTRINHEIVQGEFESYTTEEFAQDRLGMWLSDLGSVGTRAVSADSWERTGIAAAPATEGVRVFGVAFSADGMRLSLAGALKHSDGIHVELVDAYAGAIDGGLAPLADWFAEKDVDGVPRWRRSASIVLSGAAGAQVLKQLLIERRVREKRIQIVNTPQYLQACGMLDDAMKGEGDIAVTHLAADGQAALDASVSVVDKDKRGGWKATTPDGDETPLEAVSLALWGARTSRRTPQGDSERKAVIL